MRLARRPLALLHGLSSKQVIKQFASRFDFVYLGELHEHAANDDVEVVRGVTATPEHTDSHYTTGTFHERDIAIVERQATVGYPGHKTLRLGWLIMQIDLRHADPRRHVFINGAQHHGEAFYAQLGTHFIRLEGHDHWPEDVYDDLFVRHFTVYAATNQSAHAQQTVTPAIAAMLANHFRQFDYELCDDHVLIYAPASVINLHVLREMLRVGLWLANQLDESPEPEEAIS